MAILELFLLNTYAFLALQSRGANIDCDHYYATKTTSATNTCSDCNQPCDTLWDAIPSHTLPHGLCSGSYSNQYIITNIPTETRSDAFIEHEVHSLHNEFKETQLTSDLLRVFDSTKDKTEAPFTMIPNPMRRIVSACNNSTISNAKSHSQNRILLHIVN
eukprot:963651_1